MKEIDNIVISRYAEWVTSSILTITTWYKIYEAKAKYIYNRKNKHRNWNKKSTEAIRIKDYDQSTKKLVTQMFPHELRVSDKTSFEMSENLRICTNLKKLQGLESSGTVRPNILCVIKRYESESVYASESDFGWFLKVFLDHPLNQKYLLRWYGWSRFGVFQDPSHIHILSNNLC